jgi:hypothetical protein
MRDWSLLIFIVEKIIQEVKLEINGTALHLENLDEDLTVQGVIEGRFLLA